VGEHRHGELEELRAQGWEYMALNEEQIEALLEEDDLTEMRW
jgi:hypothetical protein